VEGETIQPCETGSVLEWNFLEGTFSRGKWTGYVKEREWGKWTKALAFPYPDKHGERPSGRRERTRRETLTLFLLFDEFEYCVHFDYVLM
jgi:hypothetical protein